MKVTKPVIIVLAVALVAVIGYAFYLHRGPLKNISNENQDLKNKIAHLKTASGELKAAYNSDLTAKIQLVEKLQKTNMELEKSVERIKNEKETAGTDFQKQIASFETQELNSQLGMSRVQLDAVSQEAVSKEKKLWVLNQAYEDLKTRLHEQIQEKEFKISTLEDKLNIRLLNKILFAPGQTAISPNGKRVLNNLAEELKKVEGIQITDRLSI